MLQAYFIILTVTSIAGIVLSLFFWNKDKGRKTSNRLMASLLLLYSYIIVYSLLYWIQKMPLHLNMTHLFAMSSLGPLFFLYLRTTLERTDLVKKDVLHLLPIFITLISIGGYVFSNLETKKNIFLEQNYSDYLILGDWIRIILLLVLVAYTLSSWSLIKNADKEDRDIYLWMRFICCAFTGVVLGYLTYFALLYTGVLSPVQDYFISGLMIFFILTVGYMAFVQPEVFNGRPIAEVVPFVKYQKTGLSEATSISLKQELKTIMEKDKLFLKNELSLSDLAEALQASRNHASQVINEHFNQSFYDFINGYRITEAKEIIDSNSNLSFKDIAYSVGFNNRVTFYKAFKKRTGMTPTQYSKQNKLSKS